MPSTVQPLPEVAKSKNGNRSKNPKLRSFRPNHADGQLTLFGDDHGSSRPCGAIEAGVNGLGIRSGPVGMAAAQIAIVKDYDDLLALARARKVQLGVTFETLDAVSGVQAGYSAKLLAPSPNKRFGPMSFGAIFGALGLQFVAIEDPDMLARIGHRLVKRQRPLQPRKALSESVDSSARSPDVRGHRRTKRTSARR
jgi:hypothetical protein